MREGKNKEDSRDMVQVPRGRLEKEDTEKMKEKERTGGPIDEAWGGEREYISDTSCLMKPK